MKKILFATTALVATAGVAAAEVTITGSAEMGIAGGGDDAINGTVGVTQFFNDIDVAFRMSGETDGGLQFGAGVDLDENGAFGPYDDGGAFVFTSGDFGTLTLGDTDGALDFVMTEGAGNPGSIDDSETLHMGYLGSYLDGDYDGQILRYDYAFDAFTFAVSVEMDDADVLDYGYAVGVGYAFDFAGGSVDLGAGYQYTEQSGDFFIGNLSEYLFVVYADPGVAYDVTAIGVSADVDLDSGLDASIQYTQLDIDGTDGYHIGLAGGYSFDAFSVGINWGMFDFDGTEVSGFGLAAAYDLGGGASIHFAYGDSDADGMAGDFESYSLGVAMSF